MLPIGDPYRLLQVIPEADSEVIQAAYRALARKYHPDTGGSGVKMAMLNAAWETLRDRDARGQFDRQRATNTAAKTARTEDTADQQSSTAPPLRPPMQPGGRPGTILDFGRYAGCSLGDLAFRDPDYLLWLERTSIGRRFQPEIEALMAASRPVAPRPEQARSRFSRRK